MLILEKKEDKNASANDLDIMKSTFAIVMSWKDTKAEKEGEAFTKSSGDETLYEMFILPMIRRAAPGAIKIHLSYTFSAITVLNLRSERQFTWPGIGTMLN